jgi:Tfp pilus assembly protein PilX
MKNLRRAGRGESGSAYIVTLLALVVLTVLALSLALITQTEVQVGANEKKVNRTFYAADSGLAIATAEALVSGRYTATTVILNHTRAGNANVADRVRISPLAPILTVRCDWCPANDDGVTEFWKVQHAVNATAERIAWDGNGPPPADALSLGQKKLSAMFEFAPWPSPPVDSIADAQTLQQIEF